MSDDGKGKDLKAAAAFTAGGGFAGAGVASAVGNMGLADAFGGIAIGAAPVICVCAVAGMAAFGIKKLLD